MKPNVSWPLTVIGCAAGYCLSIQLFINVLIRTPLQGQSNMHS